MLHAQKFSSTVGGQMGCNLQSFVGFWWRGCVPPFSFVITFDGELKLLFFSNLKRLETGDKITSYDDFKIENFASNTILKIIGSHAPTKPT